MNTGFKVVERKKCARCSQVYLQIAGVKLRSIRPEMADYDWSTGHVKMGLCNSPRCARFGLAEPTTTDEEDE